jgi:hypothetical protein
VNQAEEQGNTPAKQMVSMAWRPTMPLLIALTLDLKVRFQGCGVNLLQNEIAFLEILQELPTDGTIPVRGLSLIPLLMQVPIELREPHFMGQELWGHGDTSYKKSSEVLTPAQKLWEGKGARHQAGCVFPQSPSHNVVVKINKLAHQDIA